MPSEAFTLTDDEGAVLDPGTYWIELEFDRPTPKDSVEQALESMGFENVAFDYETAPEGGLVSERRVGRLVATSEKASAKAEGGSPEAIPFVVATDEVSGVSPYVFRFIARTVTPLAIRNIPGIFWKSVRKVHVDPYGEIDFRSRAQPLTKGSLYELRILSRDKRAKVRGDVLTLLDAMGFDPAKLLLFRRNMRMPKRPNTSISEWIAIARWRMPSSVTTDEDPFFFADVKEITS